MKKKYLYWILIPCLLILSIFVFFPINPSINYWLDTDGSVYLHIGQLILDGGTPYFDAWEDKPPGLYFLYALSALFGDGRWGIWFFGMLGLFISSLLGFNLLLKHFGLFPASCATFMYLIGFNILRKGGEYAEVFALPFQFLIIYLFLSSEREKTFSFKFILIGFFSALCFILKQTLIGIPFSIVIYWIFINKSSKSLSTIMVRLFSFFAGFISVVLFIFGYMVHHSVLKDFWNATVMDIILWVEKISLSEKLSAVIRLFDKLNQSFLSILAVPTWFVSIIALLRRKELDKTEKLPLIYLLIINIPIEVFLVGIHGRSRNQYFISLLPALMMLTGFFWYKFLSVYKTRFSTKLVKEGTGFLKIWIGVFLVLFPLRFLILNNIGEINDRIATYKQYDNMYSPIVEYINENTKKENYICFLGERAVFNSITGRRYPTRFTSLFERYKEVFMDDLRKNKPVLIILNKYPHWGAGTWGEFPAELKDTLFSFLDIYYTKVEPFGLDDFAIYRFNTEKPTL